VPHPLVDALSCAAPSCTVDTPGCASVPIIGHQCLAAGVVDTGVKFATVITTLAVLVENLPPVLLIPVTNLPAL
jgi:hypothetical protein